MDFYMYKSLCSGWLYGNNVDIRHIVVPEKTGERDVLKMATEQSNNINGGVGCRIELLQKYHMLIEPLKSYSALTTLTFHGKEIVSSENLSENNYND